MPDLQQLELLRKKQVSRLRFIIIAGIASLALGLATMIPFMVVIFLFLSLLLYFAFFGFNRSRPDFKSEYKRIVITRLIRFIDPGLQYSPHQFIPQTTYDFSRIFLNNPDIYSGEDLIEGNIGKTQVHFSELHTQDRRTDNRGRTYYVTIFRGIFFIADFNKNFQGQTYVLSDFSERFLGFFGRAFQNMHFGRPAPVRLEDPVFEKFFAVYSTDEVEARYILTPSFMQRIVEFRKKAEAPVQFSFIESNIYIAVPMRKNLFEPRLMATVLNFGEVEEYYRQILFCTSVIDELNLNTRIWSKQ